MRFRSGAVRIPPIAAAAWRIGWAITAVGDRLMDWATELQRAEIQHLFPKGTRVMCHCYQCGGAGPYTVLGMSGLGDQVEIMADGGQESDYADARFLTRCDK